MAIYDAPESLHVGTGVETVFGFNWPYLLPRDLLVTLNGTPVPTVLASSNQVVVAPAPAAGTIVRIFRNTPAQNPTYLFASGIPMLPRYIDGNNKQLLYALQEGLLQFERTQATADEALRRAAAAEVSAADAAASAAQQAANIRRTVRVGSTDPELPALPPASARANKVMGFDSVGNPVGVVPASGSGTELALDLASPTFGKGSRMVGHMLDAIGAAPRTVYDKAVEVVSLADFSGWDPTGNTDTSAAWEAALAYVATKVRLHAGISNPACGYEIYVPPGDYLITRASALTMAFAGRVIGLTIRAAAGTRIFYRPATPGPLFVNMDKVLYLRVGGIFFVGEDSQSDFFYSTSNGGAQDYVFEDCTFHGSWRYGMRREGGNTNSEFKWLTCAWSGTWLCWDYIAPTGTSDQFVNNWFIHPKYWSVSPWIEYHRGGHIRMVSADISGYSPTQLPAGAGPGGNRTQYLVKLMGRSHGYGVCSLSVFGGRIEQKTQWAGVLYSEWPQGALTFNAFDASSQAFTDFGANIESFYFSPGNNPGSMISFTQSELIGYLVFETQLAQGGRSRVEFNNTSFLTQAFPEDAFIFRDVSNQLGARPTVRLHNVRGRPSQTSTPTYADADLNWQHGVVAATSSKMLSLKSATGTLPAVTQGAATVALPRGAVVTRIIISVPRGASGSGATAAYTVETTEGVPTVLATLNLAPISAGGVVKTEPMFVCDSREKANLRLVPSANMNTAQGGGSFCTIEYIG